MLGAGADHHGAKAAFQEIDMLDGAVADFQLAAHRQIDLGEMRLQACEIGGRQPGQYPVRNLRLHEHHLPLRGGRAHRVCQSSIFGIRGEPRLKHVECNQEHGLKLALKTDNCSAIVKRLWKVLFLLSLKRYAAIPTRCAAFASGRDLFAPADGQRR